MTGNKLVPAKIILVLIILLSFGTVMGVIGYSLSLKNSPPVAVQPTIEPTIIPTLEPTEVPTITPAPTEDVNGKCINGRFTNIAGGYSFDCFPEWKFAIAKTNEPRTDSLFGPDATETGGMGGVGVTDRYSSIDDYLKKNSDVTLTNKRKITIDGAVGLRDHYAGFPTQGEEVVLFKDGKIYEISLRSGTTGEPETANASDINFFNRIVNSFKFIK